MRQGHSFRREAPPVPPHGTPQRAAVPVARPYIPPPGLVPPAPAPAGRPFVRAVQLGVVIAVSILCVAIGAFLLPGLSRRAPGAPGQQQPAHPSPQADSVVADVHPNDLPPPPDAADIAAPERTDAATPPPARRPMDVPKVAPQLPAGSPAAALATAIDRDLGRALAAAGVPASPLAGDAEFLRRAYLDLTGHIPPAEKARAFLDSTDPHKRARLIDELLDSPEFGRHLARIWRDLLVKRDFDNNKNLKSDAFTAWLADQFNQNKGWDKIVIALLTAEGKEAESPPTFFILANQDNNQPSPAKLTGAAANLFMGLPLQCAECHTHPFNDKWKTQDFWGMAAFFGHTRAERGGGKQAKNAPATVREVDRLPAAKGKGKAKNQGRPIPAGAVIAIPDPTDPKKTVGSARARFFESATPALPEKAPYRPALAAWLASGRNPYFAPAMVNRMWAHFFGKGFVNPIEDMRPENKPSHPQLLKLLASDFAAHGYDLKHLIRGMCNSQAYQRTSRPLPGNRDDDRLFSHMTVKVMPAEVLLDSLALATGHREPNRGAPARGNARRGGEPSLVRFFDTREYDDDPADYTYGIPQLLKLMNTRLTNSSQEAAARLVKEHNGDRDRVLEEIYLRALARRPRPEEAERMHAFAAKQGDPVKGYAGVLWALLNSAEFVANH